MIERWTFHTSGQQTTARHYAAGTDGLGLRAGHARSQAATLLLAPGAGASHDHVFMVSLASALAARGADVVTFNFPYAEGGRRRPDPPRMLEAAWRDAIASLGSRAPLGSQPLFIGGKSMGGRLATQVAAAGNAGEPHLTGVVCLGYPLQPPGRPAPRSVDHLASVRVPILILQGTRDAFGGPDAVLGAARAAGANPTVVAVDGADHGFAVPRRMGLTAVDVIDRIADHVSRWLFDVLRVRAGEQGDIP